jgi:hypothetical protein
MTHVDPIGLTPKPEPDYSHKKQPPTRHYQLRPLHIAPDDGNLRRQILWQRAKQIHITRKLSRKPRALKLETEPVVAEVASRLRDAYPTHRLRLVEPLQQLLLDLRPAFAKQSIKRIYPRMPKQCRQHGDRQRSQHDNSFEGHTHSPSYLRRTANFAASSTKTMIYKNIVWIGSWAALVATNGCGRFAPVSCRCSRASTVVSAAQPPGAARFQIREGGLSEPMRLFAWGYDVSHLEVEQAPPTGRASHARRVPMKRDRVRHA